ncbi:DUF305 domain-containing protein [Spiractinospora alimapuensis]|uniref:DUF305 domain-containing protein n=1 Tax=Spiractinospora alimapuensis TaxID=2820884 RepID=UPI001F30A312|nr:DUF305 domain-containing protein [Spiractinospora alimapuensis]
MFTLPAALAVVLSAVACSGSADSADPPPLDPGAPGDEPSELSLADVQDATDIAHNETDADFMHRMVAHHEQALEMTDLVESRHDDPSIDTIAERMSVGQQGEIELMEAWLELNVYAPARDSPAHRNYCGLDLEGAHHDTEDCVTLDHTHEDMEGMLTPEQMDELTDASGTEFDELFVEYMVQHHEGAIVMAEEVLRDGEHPVVYNLASEMALEQAVEITRLQGILTEDGGEENDSDADGA